MFRKKNKKNLSKRRKNFSLPSETSQLIFGVLLILAAVLVSLSFFQKAGLAGIYFLKGAKFLIGETIFFTPLIFVLSGIILLAGRNPFSFYRKEKTIFLPVLIAILALLIGLTGILGSLEIHKKRGGLLGYITTWPLLKYLGFWATEFILLALVVIGILIFVQYLRPREKPEKLDREIQESSSAVKEGEIEDARPSFIKKIFAPKFKIKEVPPLPSKIAPAAEPSFDSSKLETKPQSTAKISSWQPPPPDLLEKEKDVPTSGDIRVNSSIIKKTLQNFGIEVTMSEVNIGPTVTQYTFKPAEGVKLAKITNLSNDLALALASHPIRIEAPIPGRALVGIEVPNKGRAQVKLRNLIEDQNFQKSSSNLVLALGRDVSGGPVYVELTKMPHLLVAGSTGTGKTIFLNSLILSLLYQPSTGLKSGGPDFLRLILVDPKRVEFPIYNSLPHLLCPVIYSAAQTINAIKWLTGEMERRFDVLSKARTRDIVGFNELSLRAGQDPLPFIVLIIDELADLMAAKGREIEAGIVRLAQMSRAVGIHLVVATQRPSVEVITGLIKANITSRITFQVASQVDSRTVLDTAGAEKLLGSGDMLYLSAQTPKPKRIQSAHISEKEVKRVVSYIRSASRDLELRAEMDQGLVEELEQASNTGGREKAGDYLGNDPLYEEAKRLVVEARRASASLLQRRLRIGYARAARLIDILEEQGVVSPGQGAKPREVYGLADELSSDDQDDSAEWKKV